MFLFLNILSLFAQVKFLFFKSFDKRLDAIIKPNDYFDLFNFIFNLVDSMSDRGISLLNPFRNLLDFIEQIDLDIALVRSDILNFED